MSTRDDIARQHVRSERATLPAMGIDKHLSLRFAGETTEREKRADRRYDRQGETVCVARTKRTGAARRGRVERLG